MGLKDIQEVLSLFRPSVHVFVSFIIRNLHERGSGGSADRLLHADLGGDEELLHGHHVHPGEVLLHELLAVVPVAWQNREDLQFKFSKLISTH